VEFDKGEATNFLGVCTAEERKEIFTKSSASSEDMFYNILLFISFEG